MVCTKVKNHKHLYTWYVHGMYNEGYKPLACMYIVQTCMYMFIHLNTSFASYKRVHTMHKHVYAQFVQTMFSVQMATCISGIVQTAMNSVHTSFNFVRTLICPFGCSFFIRPAGWPVGWDWLLPGVTPIQVQAH